LKYVFAMNNADRVALVTGGAKRVGRAIVEKLAGSGFEIAFTYNTSESDALALQRQLGGKTLAIRADLFDPVAAASEIYSKVQDRFGRLDVLVNSASAYLPARLGQTNLELTRKLYAVHVESPLMICQKFEAMLREARGHVVNMVDLLAEKPWPEYLAYCASKAALMNLTLGLARELAPEVTVNGIAPGVVAWPKDAPEEMKVNYLKRVPLGRAGTPGDVGELVRFLVTEGKYITGQIIHLDGGRSIT
jgi:pteridine reductase